MLSARDQTTHAIVLLSDDYFSTDYCQAEYQYFIEKNIPIIAVIASDVAIGQAPTYFEINDWVDFRNRTQGAIFNITVNNVIKRLPTTEQHTNQSERQHYLFELITDIETSLAKSPTSRAVHQLHENKPYGDHVIRSRGYNINLLSQWHLILRVENGTIEIEDVLSWFESQSQFILSGKAGSGKTIIAQLLTLWVAHYALSDYSVPLPIWLDLALWLPEQSPETFIDENWPLMHYWKNWIDTYETLFIFDNWTDFCQQNPDTIAELNKQIATLADHKTIVLARDTESLPTGLEHVVIGIMPNHQIQRFARDFLDADMTGNFKRLVAQNRNQLALKHIDFIACGIELMATDAAVAVESWFTNPVQSLITLRWDNHYTDISQPFSLNYFIKTMKLLAWHMMQAEQHRWIDRGLAEEAVFKIEVIQVAIELGIMDIVGWSLRFHAELFQWYLAAERLEQDGLYKYLVYPQFSESGHRLPTRWDDVIFALVDTVGENRRQQIIDQVAEIDPYLAWEYMQQYPEEYADDVSFIVAKFIELRSKSTASYSALTPVLQQISDTEAVVQTILEEMSHYEWGVQQDLWAELQKLPIDIPEEFIKRIHTLDKQFENTIFDLLQDFSITQCLIYLTYLINHQTTAIRHNAIWLVGKLKQKSMQIGLFNLLDTEDDLTRHQAISALSPIADEKLIQKLLMWLANHLEYSGGVGTLIYDNGRYVSGRILMTLHDEDADIDSALRNAIIKHPEESIAYAVAQYIADETGQDDFVKSLGFDKDSIMPIQKLVQSGLEHLPRDRFNRFIEDIQQVLQISPDDNPVSQKRETDVYMRAQTAVTSVRRAEGVGATSGAISSNVTVDLRSSDWLVRRKATEQLAGFHSDVALPLLVNSANDPDAQVRIVALNLLAKFSDSSLAQQTLLDALSDDDVVVVDTVTDLLKQSEFIETSTLLDLLSTDNIQVLAAVIDIIGHRKHASAVPNLVPYLDDERKPWMDRTLADYAVKALLAIDTPLALEAVDQSKYKLTEAPVVSAQVVSTKPDTKKYTPLEKISLSLKVLRGDDWGLAQKSARFLREYAEKLHGTDDLEIVQLLCNALSDPEWHVRWAVAEALAWLGHRSACPYLITRLHDTNWIVQISVMRALVELKASEYAMDIAALLNHDNHAIRETVAETLGLLGNPAVISTLEHALHHPDEFVRLASIKSIHQLRDDSSVDYLLLGLDDSYLHVRWFAMKHLVPHFTEVDIDLLAQLLEDEAKPSWEEKSISDYAYDALSLINSSEARNLIKHRKISRD